MSPREAKAFKMPFGKYKSKTLQDIYDRDPKYIDWLKALEALKNPAKDAVMLFNPDLEEETE